MHTCDICGFTTENGKVMSNHKRWKHTDVVYSENGLENIRNAVKRKFPKETRTLICEKCGKSFDLIKTKAQWERHSKFFCSRSCANSRGPRTDEFKELLRKKLEKPEVQKRCLQCGTFFLTKRENIKFCSRSCSGASRRIDNKDLYSYRKRAAFKFSLKDYPEEFDFSLIEMFGWYSPSNHGDNLSGISRDHIVSVQYGFDNNIEPAIIAHPANCQLMQHDKNSSKGSGSSITIEELLERINRWDKKYDRNSL